jgi:hypothetical protein
MPGEFVRYDAYGHPERVISVGRRDFVERAAFACRDVVGDLEIEIGVIREKMRGSELRRERDEQKGRERNENRPQNSITNLPSL